MLCNNGGQSLVPGHAVRSRRRRCEARTGPEASAVPSHTVTQALGYGSAAKGGAPSTADGRLFAFGNTLESAIKTVLGLRQQGVDGQRPFDRTSGEGFVAAHDGDYADALRKRYSVVLTCFTTT